MWDDIITYFAGLSFFYWILWGFLALTAPIGIWYGIQWLRSFSMPEISVKAKITDVYDRTGIFYYTRLNTRRGYHISFELLAGDERGKTKRFFAGMDKIKKPKKGMQGILTSQGIRFISFK